MTLESKGLCPFGYYYIRNSKIKCNTCNVIEDIVENIAPMSKIKVFRALSEPEKASFFKNNYYLYRDKFEEIELDDDSYQGVINKIFSYVRDTLNNKKNSKKKQFSYSKCFVVPLFKYVKNNEENPIIAIKDIIINSFEISYECTYFQWIKGYYTRDDERTYFTESESTVDIKELLCSNLENPRIDEYLKRYYQKHNFLPLERYMDEYKYKMVNDGENSLELCDLDSIENIKIQSFTLDLSIMNRKEINDYLEYCSNDAIKIKRLASFSRDREIISTIPFDCSNRSYTLQGKTLIYYCKIIAICVLFLEEYKEKIDKEYINIIAKFIMKIRNNYIQKIDLSNVDLVIRHLKDNSKNEFKALRDILNIDFIWGEKEICFLIRMINNYCNKTSITRRFIYDLKNVTVKNY